MTSGSQKPMKEFQKLGSKAKVSKGGATRLSLAVLSVVGRLNGLEQPCYTPLPLLTPTSTPTIPYRTPPNFNPMVNFNISININLNSTLGTDN